MRRAKRVEWCLQMLLGLLLCWALPARCVGQTAPAAREQVEKVRTSVARLAPGAKISVIPIRGAEEFGLLRSSDAGGFTFFDVDEKTEKTMRYEEIK